MCGLTLKLMWPRTRRPFYKQRIHHYGCRLTTCRGLAICPLAVPRSCRHGAVRCNNGVTTEKVLPFVRDGRAFSRTPAGHFFDEQPSPIKLVFSHFAFGG